MPTITATYKIITPMFVSGAEQDQAELRIPSIKGAIRFWWRALNWCCYENTEKLYIAETKLFGGTYKKDKKDNKTIVKQSKIHFSFIENTTTTNANYKKNYSKDCSIVYLAGQGVKDTTKYMQTNTFTLQLMSKSEIDESVIRAIKIFGLLGGLGKRSRKGFGSIAIQSIHDEKFIFNTTEDYRNRIREIIALTNNHCHNGITPPYTAFSNRSEIFTSATEDSALDAHIAVAKEYKTHRKGTEYLDKGNEKRIAFGQSSPRQASPILLHIHPIDDKFISVRSYLPADHILSDKYKYIYNFLKYDSSVNIINE